MTAHSFIFALAASLTLLSATAEAQKGPRPDAPRREEFLRKIHTLRLVELGELLDYDSAETLRLGERLKPFEEQRLKLQVESFEAMGTLRRADRGDTGVDAVGAARALAQNRVKLAEVDRNELEELLKGLPPAKASKAALFVSQFNRRIERMAGDMHKRRSEGRQDRDD